MQYDQDIVDLLASLKKESVTCEGGMYAAAMPPPPQPASANTDDPSSGLMSAPANGVEVCASQMNGK